MPRDLIPGADSSVTPATQTGGAVSWLQGTLPRQPGETGTERDPIPPAKLQDGPARWVPGTARVPLRIVARFIRGGSIHLVGYAAHDRCSRSLLWYFDDQPIRFAVEPPQVDLGTTETQLPRGVKFRTNVTAAYVGSGLRFFPPGGQSVPAGLFTGSVSNPIFRRAVFGFNNRSTGLDSLQLIFSSDTQTGSGAGPHLDTPGNYHLVLRARGLTTYWPLFPSDTQEPHLAGPPETVGGRRQVEDWLLREIGTGFAGTGQIALVNHTEWPIQKDDGTPDYQRVWEGFNPSELRTLVPAPGERVRRVASRVPLIRIVEYLAADGGQNASILNVFNVPPQDDEDDGQVWNPRCRGRGLSYFHIELTQGTLEEPLWNPGHIPDIQVELEGLVYGVPGDPIPRHRRDAASFGFWFLTRRMGVTLDEINVGSFLRARAICVQPFHTFLQQKFLDDGHVADDIRYPMDGILYADDTPTQVLREIGKHMCGGIFLENGLFTFYAGHEQPVVLTITDDDLIGEPQISRVRNDLPGINGLRFAIAQDRADDYRPKVCNPAKIQTPLPDRIMDGGKLSYCRSQVKAGHLAHLALSKELANLRADVTVPEVLQGRSTFLQLRSAVQFISRRRGIAARMIVDTADHEREGTNDLGLAEDNDWRLRFVAPVLSRGSVAAGATSTAPDRPAGTPDESELTV